VHRILLTTLLLVLTLSFTSGKAIANNVSDKNLDSELITATTNGNIETVKTLIKKGANVNAFNDEDDTVLIIATRDNHKDIVALLIDNGADVNIGNLNYGETALMAATDIEIMKLLLSADANINASEEAGSVLIQNAWSGNTDIVKFLIDNGADIEAVDLEMSTALMIASMRGHTDIVKLLIASSVNLNTKDRDGYTALIFATREGHTEIINLLKSANTK